MTACETGSQLILLAIAFNITSCVFIIRSTSRNGTFWLASTFQNRRPG